MKFRTKAPSKSLGDSMRRGGTKPTQQTSNIQKGKDGIASADNEAAGSKETRLGEELEQLDNAVFESILKDAAAAKPDLVKNVASSGIDPAIMGLIDGAKQRHTAEQDLTTIANPKAPVKFDDVVDFIDDGVEDIVIGKPPTLTANMVSRSPNIKPSVRGNPVTDFDKMNEMNGINGADSMDPNHDQLSRLEMGHHSAESLDEIKVKDSQKNVKCDEKEQLDYMKEKGLNDYAKFDNILGPASQGEFASFSQNLTPVIASELGVLNPISSGCYNVFQTCTTNGRLLPAVPRKYFCTTENHQRPTCRPTPQKQPVTMMLQSAIPSAHNAVPDSHMSSVYSQSHGISPPPVAEPQGNLGESSGSKKRAKKAAKKAASKATAGDEKNSEDSEGKEDKEDVEDEDEKENNMDDGLTEKEREARRKKNMKSKEKKKAKKQEEKKELESKTVDVPETPVNSGRGGQNQNQKTSPLGVGTGSPDESPKNQQNNGRRANVGGGGKNKKNEKSVSLEYTVASNAKPNKKSKDPSADREDIGWKDESVGSHSVEEILKNIGEDVSETADKPKKNKKGNSNTSKKAAKQQKKEQAPKETARSPPSDNELELDDEAEKSKKQQGKKKMDEVAVAASITKRCSSGVGQSEEDDDQSYVSAQENLGGSNSRLSTPPAEFVDARQSRDEIIDNVMLDPNNYRDDEDVESLAKQLQQQEDEFITVGKNKKKNKKQASVQENITASSTASSSSPPNRRNSTTGPISNVSPSGNNQSQQHHSHQRNNNRPVAHPTTLGDFMESTKKDTHKNIKHKKVMSPINPSAQKKPASLDEPTPSSPAFVDALETPISVNTAPAFSYADAAKKSSGENTPAHEMSPVPQLSTNATPTPAKSPSVPHAEVSKETKKTQEVSSSYASPKFVSTTKSSAVQLPAGSVTAVDSDISFGYEETPEDKRKREQKEATTLNAQTQQLEFRMSATTLLNTLHDASRDKKLNNMPKNGSSESNVLSNEILRLWNDRWVAFKAGSNPSVYKPSSSTK